MSLHAYSRVWIHMVWGTLDRQRLLAPAAAAQVSGFLTAYSQEKQLFQVINYVNAEHVHVLFDLPTNTCIEEAAQWLKGASSHWINEQGLVPGKFAWGRGYGAFSVSQSAIDEVARYIATQEEHHRARSFEEELKLFVERYGLRWQTDEASVHHVPTGQTVETVSRFDADPTPLKRGVTDTSP